MHPDLSRTGAYARESHGSAKSVDEQTREVIADVERRGGVVAGLYTDTVSASRFTAKARSDWLRLLDDLRSGTLSALGMWESSRGDRDLASWASMLALCREYGRPILVTSHGRVYDMRVARDWRTLAEDGVDSAYESEKLSQRLRRSAAVAAGRGLPHGRVRYGYERVYDPTTRRLVQQRPREGQAAIVREIFTRVVRGDPVSAITADLNARGIPSPTGVAWARSAVRDIATGLTYIGVRVHGGEQHPGTWPPLVDAATFWAAQRILSDPARTTTRPGRARYLLSYIATCGVCGAPVSAGMPSHGRGPNYRCSTHGHAVVQVAALDELVTKLVLGRLRLPDVARRLRAGGDDAAAVAARARAEQLRARLDEARDSAARGETSLASLARIEATLVADIAAADAAARRAATPPVLRELLASPKGIAARWATIPLAARREVVRLLVTIELHPAGLPWPPVHERVTIGWRGVAG